MTNNSYHIINIIIVLITCMVGLTSPARVFVLESVVTLHWQKKRFKHNNPSNQLEIIYNLINLKSSFLLSKLGFGQLRRTGGGVVRDESICLSTPSQEGSMHGGVVAGMSVLSGKQYLQGS